MEGMARRVYGTATLTALFEGRDESRAAHWVSRVVHVTAKLSLADYHAAAPISTLSPRRARLTSYGGVPIILPGLRKS